MTKQKEKEKECYKIYYDLDNTLALFSEKGKEKESLKAMYKKGFFANLEPIEEDLNDLIKDLQANHFEIHILSNCINTPYCKTEKLEWVKKHLPAIKENNIHLLPQGSIKANHVDVKDSFLVDDYKKNLLEWQNKGGYAIKKSSRIRTKGKYRSIYSHYSIYTAMAYTLCDALRDTNSKDNN